MEKIGLFGAAVLATTFVGYAPSTVSAHDIEVCAMAGTVTLESGFGLPPSKKTTTFIITPVGACLPTLRQSLIVTGTVDGACGQSKGQGTAQGHQFAYTEVGTLLVLSGGVTGVVTAFADPTRDSNSCVDGTARYFQWQGAVALTVHDGCAIPVNTQTPKTAVMVCTTP